MFGTKKEVEKKADAAEKIDFNIKVEAARTTKNDSIVMIDLLVNGVSIRSCMLKEVTVKEDGEVHKKGDTCYIVQFPSEKGKNGKYYNRCWFPISNEDLEEIVHQTESLLS